MKSYYIVLIVVILVVIVVVCFLIYKIFALRMRVEEVAEEQEQLHLTENEESRDHQQLTDLKDLLLPVYELEQRPDRTDGSNDDYHEHHTPIQPDVKKLKGASVERSPSLHSQSPPKEEPQIILTIQYIKERMIFKINIVDIENLSKPKAGSSELYLDIQLSPFRHRTYRNPGFRRPFRLVVGKNVDFRIGHSDLKVQYLLVYFLRYDPFSRLHADGEVCVKLCDLVRNGLFDERKVFLRKDIRHSKQEFTAFIFRPR